jgi:phage terminase Nu1 subunit (DNA packaging protein)
MVVDTDATGTQETFGTLVGVSQPKVSQLISEGILTRDATLGDWLLLYCERLREQAAGRLSGGQASLMQERAALTRSQREEQDRKNAVARGEYAPIGLLADVLGAASAAVVDRVDLIDSALRKACPDLPESARAAVQTVIASARNEWIRSTASLIEGLLDDEDGADGGELAEADA